MISPSSVDVSLEPVTTQTVPVKINTVAVAPAGFSVTDEKVSPETVQVSGAASLMEQIDAAWVDLNLTGVQMSLERDLVLSARGKDGRPARRPHRAEHREGERDHRQDRRGADLPGQPVDQRQRRCRLPGGRGRSRPTVRQRLAAPSTSSSRFQSLTTDTIPVDGAQSDVQRSVKLHLPEGARRRQR